MADENKSGYIKGLYELASIGITLVAATFIGLLIGIYIDDYFNTRPLFMILFLIFGVIAGFKNVYYIIKKHGGFL